MEYSANFDVGNLKVGRLSFNTQRCFRQDFMTVLRLLAVSLQNRHRVQIGTEIDRTIVEKRLPAAIAELSGRKICCR
jgi:hypothetical protein